MKRVFVLVVGFTVLFTLMAAPVQPIVLATVVIQTQVQSQSETFMGVILKNGDNFVLSDSATKTRYMLDDTRKASPFEGKTVKVTGTLDIANNMIHVEAIQDVV
jgi:hypothetical protein